MIYQREFSSEEIKKIGRAKDALGRLRGNPTDAVAVVALYEACGRELQEVAVRYFGKNKLGKKGVLNLLAAVVSHVWSYDPQRMNASEWFSRMAGTEARKLRAALDSDNSRARRIARAV